MIYLLFVQLQSTVMYSPVDGYISNRNTVWEQNFETPFISLIFRASKCEVNNMNSVKHSGIPKDIKLHRDRELMLMYNTLTQF